MTRDELIAQLRDIHLPPTGDDPSVLGFAVWPIIVFAFILLVTLGYRAWRLSAWRRDARAALRRIEGNLGPTEQWPALLNLAVRIARIRGRTTPLPEIAYRVPDKVDQATIQTLAAHIRAETLQ